MTHYHQLTDQYNNQNEITAVEMKNGISTSL